LRIEEKTSDDSIYTHFTERENLRLTNIFQDGRDSKIMQKAIFIGKWGIFRLLKKKEFFKRFSIFPKQFLAFFISQKWV
jgi:hypothetical protein